MRVTSAGVQGCLGKMDGEGNPIVKDPKVESKTDESDLDKMAATGMATGHVADKETMDVELEEKIDNELEDESVSEDKGEDMLEEDKGEDKHLLEEDKVEDKDLDKSVDKHLDKKTKNGLGYGLSRRRGVPPPQIGGHRGKFGDKTTSTSIEPGRPTNRVPS